MQQTGGVFQVGPSSSFFIQGGQFVQNGSAQTAHNCCDANDGFKHLQAHVAPTAYTSQQEGDAPKCHPNTRTAILKAVMDWVLITTMRLQWILWINGAAGAGKSSIARSVVDLCLEQQIIVVCFFFFRTDPTRNNIKTVVATLAYQLIQSIPALYTIITPRIRSNPLVFQESLETQFRVLIFEPLRQLQKESSFEKSIVFLVDGVDECSGDNNQTNVIHIISQFVGEKAAPVVVIFSSRAELPLQMAFNSLEIENILRRLPLDTDYRAAEDIRLFLDDSCAKIKTTHPFKFSIDPEWPAPSLLQEVVNKSSNQFIYASVIVKFISSPRLHPVQQLEIIHGLRPVGELMPFAQLDALYRHIFSQVQDITRVAAILAIALSSNYSRRFYIRRILNIMDNDIDVALAGLSSVISLALGEVIFLHASLPDFLLDQSRAKQYYIDKGYWYAKFAVTMLNKSVDDLSELCIYLKHATITPQLRDAVYGNSPSNFVQSYCSNQLTSYIDTVHKMDFGDGGDLYRHQLDLAVRYMRMSDLRNIHLLGEKHDITGILGNIAREKVPAVPKFVDRLSPNFRFIRVFRKK